MHDSDIALLPAFIDGLVVGMDKRASLVSAFEGTYLDSTYQDMVMARDKEMRLSLVLSKVPKLASKRITFTVAIWTDAGWGKERFSTTDVRVNQRDPERHKHAAHNAMVASDKYAWLYGEFPWITAKETPLMRQYWQANIDAHKPMELDWQPVPKWDYTDYTAHDQQMANQDAASGPRRKRTAGRSLWNYLTTSVSVSIASFRSDTRSTGIGRTMTWTSDPGHSSAP